MYIHSIDINNLKIILSKQVAEQLILKQTSQTVKKYIITAILKAAFKKRKIPLKSNNIIIKLTKYRSEKYMLEYCFTVKPTYCYKTKALKEIALLLKIQKRLNAKTSKLYRKSQNYYLLSDKKLSDKAYIKSEHVAAILNEYAHIISENAVKELSKIL